MIDEEKTVSKEIEQAQKAVEQEKARLQRAKSKEAEKKRKEDNHNKIVWGGIVKKYFPDCVQLDEAEMNEILAGALASADCRQIIQKIKRRSAGYGTYQKPLSEERNDAE
jgi:hypothetical protein